MNRQTKNIFILFIIIAVFISLFYVTKISALDTPTHRAINERIANKNLTFNNFSLHQYLIEQLGLQNGIETPIKNKWVIKWLSDGGEMEDKPDWPCAPHWRQRNHFHNPIDNSGFSGVWDTGIYSGISALEWVSEPQESQSCGYYSWNDARNHYYNALTAADKDTRETNFAETFRALGQVMHLVQDVSLPEHTRIVKI